jgi:hypothetical protein
MPKKDQIDRMLVLIYRSRNSHGCTNFTRSIDWLDKLPMAGLEELDRMFEVMREDVAQEIEARKAEGITRYSREWHESQEADRKAGADLLSGIGIKSR